MSMFFVQPRPKKTAAPPPSKKRKTVHAVEEISFDKDARAEYLTGFRKRKQARIKQAQEIAEKKAREERIETRKKIREERKQALEEHVETVNKILREAQNAGADKTQGGSEEEEEQWEGLSDSGVPEAPINLEEEYIDEDRYTTVTVEAVRVDRDGLHKPELETSDQENSDQEEADKDTEETKATGPAKRPRPPKKKKTFRYETKFERDIANRKQRAKRSKRQRD